MIEIVKRNAYLRPMTSPMRPKTTAPNGRTRKPAAYAAKAESADAVGLSFGKKIGARNGVSVAYREKSYHSMIVPADEAPMTNGRPYGVRQPPALTGAADANFPSL